RGKLESGKVSAQLPAPERELVLAGCGADPARLPGDELGRMGRRGCGRLFHPQSGRVEIPDIAQDDRQRPEIGDEVMAGDEENAGIALVNKRDAEQLTWGQIEWPVSLFSEPGRQRLRREGSQIGPEENGLEPHVESL